MGILAAANGIGDLVSSALVGVLWSAFPATPAIGLFAAAGFQIGGVLLAAGACAESSAPLRLEK